jgi:signal transduction histidine kinase
MMRDFLADNREELIERCRARAAQRPARAATALQLQNGVPMFLDQLVAKLDAQQAPSSMGTGETSGTTGGEISSSSPIGKSAGLHGRMLFTLGYSIEQVVHDYGDLCQSIMDLAYERDANFPVSDFRTLNRCLDDAIADAATEYTYQREVNATADHALEMDEQLGILADDLRCQLGTAALAFAAARTGSLNLSGATGSLLEHSLMNLQNLIDTSLAERRLGVKRSAKHQLILLADFIAEIRNTANIEARARGFKLTVPAVDTAISVDVDHDLLLSAVGNLMKNAFKFSHEHAQIILNAYSVADRVLIDVVNDCGGLPLGEAEKMSSSFMRPNEDKSELGAALSIAWRSVKANDGALTVRNVPGKGCIFTISLPRYVNHENMSTM